MAARFNPVRGLRPKLNDLSIGMKSKVFFLLFSFGLFTLIFGAVLVGFAANEIYFLKPVKEAPSVTVTIPPNVTLRQISKLLADKKLISSQWLFELYVKTHKLDRQMQPGTFTIVEGTNMRRVAQFLTRPGRSERSITIIEGWTLKDIAKYADTLGIPNDQLYRITGEPATTVSHATAPTFDVTGDFSFLKSRPKNTPLEGFLFPDTYRVYTDATAEDVVRKMLTNFSQKVGSISYEQLILASIVEREVRGENDRALVADILKRRLDIGMPLQVDSSVNYITGKKTPAISAQDRAIDSPYNTYRYKGLPPTPISNPGLTAITAVQKPKSNFYWYFLTDVESVVHYARTLEEHTANKQRYIR